MVRCKDLLIGAALGSLLTAALLAAAGPGSSLDPVVVSPQLYTVRLDNDRVRVLEYRLQAGGREPLHSHLAGVVVALSDATMRTTLPEYRHDRSALPVHRAQGARALAGGRGR